MSTEDAEFRLDAIARTPDMFDRLCGALRLYASSHATAALNAKAEESSFRISRSVFPTLFLQIQIQRGAIGYVATRKRNTSAGEDRVSGTIVVFCAGQDQFYYRLDGDDIASEVQLAQHLLTGLF
jgi:hypothetical protein